MYSLAGKQAPAPNDRRALFRAECALHDNLGLERLKVFFRNATSVSFVPFSSPPNHQWIQEFTYKPWKGSRFEGPGIRFKRTATVLLYL
jgi:hypothetical protein